MTAFAKLLLAAGILAVVALAPCATVLAVPPDVAAPAELQLKLPAVKDAVVDGLDRHQWTRARYIGSETRAADNLVVVMFELYGWPNLVPLRAYLSSRCRAIADIDPSAMGGGVVEDFTSDPELQHLRSPAQNPC